MNAPRIITAAAVATASLASTAQAAAPVTIIRSSARLTVSNSILYGQVRCQIDCDIAATAKTTIKHKSKTIGTFKVSSGHLNGIQVIDSPKFPLKKSMAKSLRRRLKHHHAVNVTMTITVTTFDGAAPVTDVNTLPLVRYKDTVKKG